MQKLPKKIRKICDRYKKDRKHRSVSSIMDLIGRSTLSNRKPFVMTSETLKIALRNINRASERFYREEFIGGYGIQVYKNDRPLITTSASAA